MGGDEGARKIVLLQHVDRKPKSRALTMVSAIRRGRSAGRHCRRTEERRAPQERLAEALTRAVL